MVKRKTGSEQIDGMGRGGMRLRSAESRLLWDSAAAAGIGWVASAGGRQLKAA